jgi:polyisoprenoid-binding protein YceI
MVLTDTEVFWQIEKAHSEIGFKVGNLLISDIFGQFKDYTAKICTQGHDFTKSKIHFYLDPKSLETEDENLTNHLIGPDFFDTDCYNEIRFISYSLEKIKNSKHFQLTGNSYYQRY